MKRWVFTATVEPPRGVVSGRFGSSVLFVAYHRLLDQWYWIYPGGEEKIAQPPLIYVEEQWARANRTLGRVIKVEKNLAIRKKKCEQLMLL